MNTMDEINTKTDEEVVEIVRKNNKELYAHLINRYQNKLMRYAEYLIGDHDKASDAVQESFIKAFIKTSLETRRPSLASRIWVKFHATAGSWNK